MAQDIVTLDRNVGDLAAGHVVQEMGKRQGRLRAAARRSLEQVEKCDKEQANNDPKGEILAEIIHATCLSLPRRGFAPTRGDRPAVSVPAEHRMLTALNNSKPSLR